MLPMKKSKSDKIKILRFENLGSFSGIRHFVFSRKGGVSKAPFDGLNLSLHVGDKKEDVLSNRRAVAKRLAARPSDFIYLKQVHNNRVKIVIGKHRGRGAREYSDAIGGFDALITKTPGVFLTVLLADCVPVLLFDPKKKVIGAVHAGWRGTMKEIVKKTVDKMKKEFDCDPEDIIAGIGPSIGPCCFEVGENVYHLANIFYSAHEDVVIKKRNRTFVNLWQANRLQLLRAGLLEKNIEAAEICTACNIGEFYSARRERKTGRFGVGIMLRKLKGKN